LRADEGAAREGYDVLTRRGAVPDEVLRDEDAVAVADTEGALVEELVVQRTQAEAVVDVIRAAERPPAHVRGLQTDRHRPKPPVVSAEGALVLVGRQYKFPHSPVPPSPR
jgi:hypothetical protein